MDVTLVSCSIFKMAFTLRLTLLLSSTLTKAFSQDIRQHPKIWDVLRSGERLFCNLCDAGDGDTSNISISILSCSFMTKIEVQANVRTKLVCLSSLICASQYYSMKDGKQLTFCSTAQSKLFCGS